MSKKITAIYVRVSSTSQTTRSQIPDLKRWVKAHGLKVKVYTDKMSGKTMDRPAWNKLQAAMDSRRVSKLVVWKMDRLGRTAAGLTALFDYLIERKIGFVSVTEGFDLSTAAGKLVANVLASVSEYENSVRSERIRAGQQVAMASGKKWGGSVKGVLHTATERQAKAIIKMKAEGEKIAAIAEVTGLSRPTVYRIIERVKDGSLVLTSKTKKWKHSK